MRNTKDRLQNELFVRNLDLQNKIHRDQQEQARLADEALFQQNEALLSSLPHLSSYYPKITSGLNEETEQRQRQDQFKADLAG